MMIQKSHTCFCQSRANLIQSSLTILIVFHFSSGHIRSIHPCVNVVRSSAIAEAQSIQTVNAKTAELLLLKRVEFDPWSITWLLLFSAIHTRSSQPRMESPTLNHSKSLRYHLPMIRRKSLSPASSFVSLDFPLMASSTSVMSLFFTRPDIADSAAKKS